MSQLRSQLRLPLQRRGFETLLEERGQIIGLDRTQLTHLSTEAGIPLVDLADYQMAVRFTDLPEVDTPDEMRAALITRVGGDKKTHIGDGRYVHISALSDEIAARAYGNHKKSDPRKVTNFEKKYRNQ